MIELSEFQLRQRDKLYEDFDKECTRVLHMTSNEVRNVFLKFGDDMFDEFNDAFLEGGKSQMWYKMMFRICALSVLYKQRELPEDAPWLDLYDHSRTIGIDLEELYCE